MTKKKMTLESFNVRSFIITTLRGAFRKTPLYNEAKKRSKREVFISNKAGDGEIRRVKFECAKCGNLFSDKVGAREIAVDHKIPVVDSERGWTDYNDFINRLYCDITNLQVLCKNCHDEKTKVETKNRVNARKKLKKSKEAKSDLS